MVSALLLVFIAAVLVLISVQNAGAIVLAFLSWRIDLSVSTVIIAAVLTGIVVAQLLRRVMTKRQEQTRNTVEFISRRRM